MNKTILNHTLGCCLLISAWQVTAQVDGQPDWPIEKISVVSSRTAQPISQVATSITVIDQLDLQLASGLNVTELLRRAPSVSVSNSGGLGKNTVVRIRGEEGFRSKLYIDDVELSDPSSPQVAPVFDDVLLSHLARIEILRGSQGLAYGADAGGVISMYTQEPSQQLLAQASVSTSGYDTSALAASVAGGNQTANGLLAVSALSSNGFNAQTADQSGEIDGYDNRSVYAKGKLELNSHWQLKFVSRHVDANNQYDSCFDNATFALTHDCETRSKQTTVRSALVFNASASSHQLAIERTDVSRDFFSEQQFSFSNSGQIDQVSYLGELQLDSYQLVFGADTKEQTISAQGVSRRNSGAFIEWLASFDHDIDVNAGVRYDHNDNFGKHTSVRIGAVKRIALSAATLKLKSSYGTGFRAPSLFEQNYNDGPFAFAEAAGLQLKEENSQGLDIGFELFTHSGTHFELVWFKQSIDDQIVFDLSSFQGYLQAEGRSTSKGVELQLEHQFQSQWQLWANYTYNQATDADNAPRLRRPRNKLNFGLRKQLLNPDWTFELRHRVSLDAIDINSQALPDYQVTDVSAIFRPTPDWSIAVNLSNLFDREYQEVSGFNTAGRTLQVSATVSL